MYQSFFSNLGEEWIVKPEVQEQLEEFTCLIYGQSREKSINTVRSIMLKQMVGEDEQLTNKSKVDLSRLPPCQDNLVPHIFRVNHRLAHYKRADQAIFECPKPYDPKQGWEKTEDGILEPVWSTGPILPSSLIDLLEKTTAEIEEDGEEEEIEFDYELLNDDD